MKHFDNKLKELEKTLKLNESWDKELENIRKRREQVRFWNKEHEKSRREKLKKKMRGETY